MARSRARRRTASRAGAPSSRSNGRSTSSIFWPTGDSELALHEIAARAGLNNSTCHHLLATLVKRGYVGRNRRTRSYFLGARITELSNSRLKQFNLTDIAMPELKQLNETTRESVHLAVMQGHALVTLAKLEFALPVGVGSDETGKTNAAHATATGKAILAWLPEAEIARVIASHGMPRFTEQDHRHHRRADGGSAADAAQRLRHRQ